MRPKVSVIIPSYKPEKYLWECLDAINKQDLDKSLYEVIIVLNGCKEPYESRINKHIEGFEGSWRLIQLDDGGVSNARNIGIDNAEGEFIAFIDDDDYVSDSYLKSLLKVSSIDTVGLARPLAFKDDTREIVPYALTKEFDLKSKRGVCPFYFPKRLFAGPCMKLIHRDVLGEKRFDVRFKNSEDSLYMFSISCNIKKAAFTVPDAVYYRRYRDGSAITTKRSFWNKVSNANRIMWEETKLFWGHFPRYNFLFYSTRLLGAIRGAIKR